MTQTVFELADRFTKHFHSAKIFKNIYDNRHHLREDIYLQLNAMAINIIHLGKDLFFDKVNKNRAIIILKFLDICFKNIKKISIHGGYFENYNLKCLNSFSKIHRDAIQFWNIQLYNSYGYDAGKLGFFNNFDEYTQAIEEDMNEFIGLTMKIIHKRKGVFEIIDE